MIQIHWRSSDLQRLRGQERDVLHANFHSVLGNISLDTLDDTLMAGHVQ
jgi:hypothetical protein